MADTLDNVVVTQNAWVDLSSASGIVVGTAYDITNQKGGWVLLRESDSEPDLEETSGRRLAVFPDELSEAYVATGSSKIWAKMLTHPTITASELNLQER